MDRRLGIPITLSILYIELGRRLGLPLQGVSFPGHFLVILPVSHGAVVLDPYSEGASLEMADLERLLSQADPGRHWENDQIRQLLERKRSINPTLPTPTDLPQALRFHGRSSDGESGRRCADAHATRLAEADSGV
ncbi:MAG: hypothetical protein CVV18_08770, partial [Gammaproteobacteria bacterium HGW-Gammaproteobacteria-8]